MTGDTADCGVLGGAIAVCRLRSGGIGREPLAWAHQPGYHRVVDSFVGVAAGWYHAALLGTLPWAAAVGPRWAPTVVALVLVAHLVGARPSRVDPLPWCAAGASALIFLFGYGHWTIALSWLILAVAIAGLEWWGFTRGGGWRNGSGVVAVVGWAVVFAAAPHLLEISGGGWVAPAVLLLSVRRISSSAVGFRGARGSLLLPPSREVRGTLSLRSVVAAGPDGLPRSVPIDLELRAGQSLAVLSGGAEDGWALAQMFSGRRAAVAGEVAIDGSPLREGDRLVAVVAPGEAFLEGDLELNLASLCDDFPERETLVATMEACALEDVAEILGGEPLKGDGAPLSTLHRMQVAAARVIPSSYRLIVVVDPMPWTNAVHGEIWRSTVVRASLGRTAIWLTADRELAGRADRVLAFRSGGLREVDLDS